MIRINKKGITFGYNNDEITWFWWWARGFFTTFYSLIYELNFNTFKEYWMHVGKVDIPLPITKIQGYGIDDLVHCWVKQKMRVGSYVILVDINVEAKPASFWRSIPDRDKMQLTKDVVVLKCDGNIRAQELARVIPSNFARVMYVSDGFIYPYMDQPEV